MKQSLTAPFTFEAGKRAVLLLHGFTGSSADVRMLGRFLEKKGYTSHAPHYKGHGVPPEQLIESSPDEWWEDVVNGYNYLKAAGYDEIAVVGLSLGGVFSLKVGLTTPVKGIVTMCAPMTMRTTDVMFEGVMKYAKFYKIQQGKKEHEIEGELAAIREHGMPSLPALQTLIQEVRASLDLLYAPLFVIQSRYDEVIDPNSAHTIYEQSESLIKEIKWFEHSKHVITLDKERDLLHEAIYTFLERLDWTV